MIFLINLLNKFNYIMIKFIKVYNKGMYNQFKSYSIISLLYNKLKEQHL